MTTDQPCEPRLVHEDQTSPGARLAEEIVAEDVSGVRRTAHWLSFAAAWTFDRCARACVHPVSADGESEVSAAEGSLPSLWRTTSSARTSSRKRSKFFEQRRGLTWSVHSKHFAGRCRSALARSTSARPACRSPREPPQRKWLVRRRGSETSRIPVRPRYHGNR